MNAEAGFILLSSLSLRQCGDIAAKHLWANRNLTGNMNQCQQCCGHSLTVHCSISVLGVWTISVDCECIHRFSALASCVNLGADLGTILRL